MCTVPRAFSLSFFSLQEEEEADYLSFFGSSLFLLLAQGFVFFFFFVLLAIYLSSSLCLLELFSRFISLSVIFLSCFLSLSPHHHRHHRCYNSFLSVFSSSSGVYTPRDVFFLVCRTIDRNFPASLSLCMETMISLCQLLSRSHGFFPLVHSFVFLLLFRLPLDIPCTSVFSLDIRGDCFLSTAFDDEEVFERVDFTKEEFENFMANPPDSKGRYRQTDTQTNDDNQEKEEEDKQTNIGRRRRR